MDVLCRYIPIDFETELFPSVKISDEKISLVISLVFSDFLVVLILMLLLKSFL